MKKIRLGDSKKVELRSNSIDVGFNVGKVSILLPLGVSKGEKLYKVKGKGDIRKIWSDMSRKLGNKEMGSYSELYLEGLGYNFSNFMKKRILKFEGGYSHYKYLKYGKEVEVFAEKKRLYLYSYSKKKLGDIKRKVRSLKRVDKYKGKGVRVKDEVIELKIGKKR